MDKDIVLLSGGAGNIAQAIIRKYLENGCIVVSMDIKENNPNNEFDYNKNYSYYQVDVTDSNSLCQIEKQIQEKHGRITHVVSAAGIPMRSEFNGIKNLSLEDIDQSIKLNLNSHIYITKIFLSLLENDRNKNKTITYVSSINGIKNFDIPAYSAAKAGLYGFMYGIAKEFGAKGIRVNTISPGTVPTTKDIAKGGEILEYKKSVLAMKEFATTQDIADSMFAITHVMKALVGQNVVIDNGQVL